MGWATATGHADAPALALFAVMFVWQIPHFVAIAIFRAEDYAGAGFRVLSLAREPVLTRLTIVVSTVLLVPVSLLLPLLGVAGPVYLVAALVLGAGLRGDRRAAACAITPATTRARGGRRPGPRACSCIRCCTWSRCSGRWRSTGRC